MFRHLSYIFVLFVLTTPASPQMGQAGSRSGMPAGVQMPPETKSVIDLSSKKRMLLSSYCRLDYDGARLRSNGWKLFKPYTSMSANPEYRRLVVVSRYNVDTPQQSSDLLYVSYQQVGYYDELGGYVGAATSERVEFQIEEDNGEVMVTKVFPEMPHVSPRAAIAWMNLRLADSKSSDLERTHLRDAVEQLSKFLPRPRLATPSN